MTEPAQQQSARRTSLRRDTSGRVVGVDLARTLALLGMVVIHLARGTDSTGQVTVAHQVAGGRASALFAVVAGVSLALVSGGRHPVTAQVLLTARCALLVRAALVIALGLWLGSLRTHIAVILAYYGVMFVLCVPLLGLKARKLALLATGWCLAAPLLSHVVRSLLPPSTAAMPTPDAVERLGLDWLIFDLTLTGYYPAVPWLAYLIAGMAVGRLDLRSNVVAARLLLGGAAVAGAAWLLGRSVTAVPAVQRQLTASFDPNDPPTWPDLEQELIAGLHGTTPTGSWWWLAVAAPHTATALDLAQTAGSAMAVLGGCLLLTRSGRRAWSIVGGAGAMTLTLYTLHVWLVSGLIPRAVPGALAQHLVLLTALGAAFAALGLKGPLELAVTGVSAAVGRRCAALAAALQRP